MKFLIFLRINIFSLLIAPLMFFSSSNSYAHECLSYFKNENLNSNELFIFYQKILPEKYELTTSQKHGILSAQLKLLSDLSETDFLILTSFTRIEFLSRINDLYESMQSSPRVIQFKSPYPSISDNEIDNIFSNYIETYKLIEDYQSLLTLPVAQEMKSLIKNSMGIPHSVLN